VHLAEPESIIRPAQEMKLSDGAGTGKTDNWGLPALEKGVSAREAFGQNCRSSDIWINRNRYYYDLVNRLLHPRRAPKASLISSLRHWHAPGGVSPHQRKG